MLEKIGSQKLRKTKIKKTSLPITDPKMTRFFISLHDGIKFVLNSFERMQGGEIFIPKLPSCYIKDIAKALSPKTKLKIISNTFFEHSTNAS